MSSAAAPTAARHASVPAASPRSVSAPSRHRRRTTSHTSASATKHSGSVKYAG